MACTAGLHFPAPPAVSCIPSSPGIKSPHVIIINPCASLAFGPYLLSLLHQRVGNESQKNEIIPEPGRSLGHTSAWKPLMKRASGPWCWKIANFCCCKAQSLAWRLTYGSSQAPLSHTQPCHSSSHLNFLGISPALQNGVITAECAPLI